MQDKLSVSAEEAFDGRALRYTVVEHGNDNISVLRRLLFADNNLIAAENARADHTVALNGKEKKSVARELRRGEHIISVVIFRGKNGRTCRNSTDERHAYRSARVFERDGTFFALSFFQMTLFFEPIDIIVRRSGRFNAEFAAHIAHRGREAVFIRIAVDKGEYFV